MRNIKPAVLLSLLLVFSFRGSAQDSAFINNYKDFRSLVDAYKTFSVHLVPFQSSRLYAINTSKDYFKSAYQFLRNKETVTRKPDFIIAVLVDSLALELVTEEVTSKSNIKDAYEHREEERPGRFSKWDMTDDKYAKRYHYQVTFNVVIETREKNIYRFPLAVNEKFVTGYLLTDQGDASIGKFQDLLEKVLERYKNYYIDRVDW